MKDFAHKGLCLVFVLMYTVGHLDAQTLDNETILTAVEAKTDPEMNRGYKKEKSTKPLSKSYYRHHKKLPSTFEGFVIELTTSDLPLRRDYHLFNQFGQVYFDHVKGEGYSYCVMANFSSLSSIRSYLKKSILHRAPEARIVEYRKGGRKLITSD